MSLFRCKGVTTAASALGNMTGAPVQLENTTKLQGSVPQPKQAVVCNSTAAHLFVVIFLEGSPFKKAAKTSTWLECLGVFQHGKGLLQPVPCKA